MKERQHARVTARFYADPVTPGEQIEIPKGAPIVVTDGGRTSVPPGFRESGGGALRETFEYNGVAYTTMGLYSYVEAVDTPDDDTSQQT